eukprot:81641-Chlamydomonas_euryale.AAC.12
MQKTAPLAAREAQCCRKWLIGQQLRDTRMVLRAQAWQGSYVWSTLGRNFATAGHQEPRKFRSASPLDCAIDGTPVGSALARLGGCFLVFVLL